MQIYKLKLCCLVLLCLGSVLCACISSSLAEEERLDKCLEYATHILEVQKFREMLQIGAQEMERRYATGNITKEQLDTTLAVWHNTDIELRAKVSKMYEAAATANCFEAPAEKEKK